MNIELKRYEEFEIKNHRWCEPVDTLEEMMKVKQEVGDLIIVKEFHPILQYVAFYLGPYENVDRWSLTVSSYPYYTKAMFDMEIRSHYILTR